MMSPRKVLRCAIYTRKSTEHNLDLEFNSLDAQREACEAYIKSQAHEGWRLVRARYDDGGLSGASLDRLALQELLGDVRGGKIDVNGRESPTYFARPVLRMIINQPFVATNRLGQFDVWCTVKGGGLSGQAGAVRHGISRALTYYEPGLRPLLKQQGFLTRDSRIVERKKYGKHKARKRPQYSKR